MVYKARDTGLDRIVAIKVSKEQFSGRFEREAPVPHGRQVAPMVRSAGISTGKSPSRLESARLHAGAGAVGVSRC